MPAQITLSRPSWRWYDFTMGFESVELVLEVEDRFQVSLPVAEWSRVRTVAELASLVVARLPKPSEACPTARMFLIMRNTLAQECGIDRRALRPSTPLTTTFPNMNRRYRWKKLSRSEPRIPGLELTENARRGFDAVSLFLLMLWVLAAVAFLSALGVLGGVLSVIALIVSAIALIGLQSRIASEFSAG